MPTIPKRRKLERTNHAIDVDTLEAIDASVSIDDVFSEFMLAKRAEASSKRTLLDYTRHYKYLKTWLDVNYPDIRLSQMTTKILHEYISYMTNEKTLYDDHPRNRPRDKNGIIGLSPVTVNVRIRTMKAFFNWCHRVGHIRTNITNGVKLQKVDDDRIMSFTTEQIRKLLDMPDRKSFVGFRDYVIMMALFDTGLRIGELFGLKIENVNFDNLELTVPWEKAKTRKMRSVPISKRVAELIAELSQENVDFGPAAKHLFYSCNGEEFSHRQFDKRLKEYAQMSKITGVRVSAHTFRHTFAVHWIKAGGDPFSLQKILGHTDMSMVKRYVRLSDSDVQAQHNQFSIIHTLGKTRSAKAKTDDGATSVL